MNLKSWCEFQEEIEERLDRLQKGDQYLEAFFLSSAVLENEAASYVKLLQDEINDSLSSKKSVKKIDFDLLIKSKKITLGEWIGRLEAYGGDEEIVDEMKFFNKVRTKCVHNMFEDGPTNLNSELKKHHVRFIKLMISLIRAQRIILKRDIFRLRRRGALKNRQQLLVRCVK